MTFSASPENYKNHHKFSFHDFIQIIPSKRTVEKLQEGSLRTGGTLDTSQAQVVPGSAYRSLVHDEFLQPERRSLTHSRQLGRLKVSEAQSWQGTVVHGELGQSLDDSPELWQEDVETVAQNYKVLKDEKQILKKVFTGKLD